jgi:hypothetical protein
MLVKRLFRFGFESPAEARANARDGTDFESSTGIWIMSESDEAALAWGQTIAERLIASLFESENEHAYSWTEARFAHWIEKDPRALSAASYLPVVAVGEMPDLAVLAADA